MTVGLYILMIVGSAAALGAMVWPLAPRRPDFQQPAPWQAWPHLL
jgi:hypothetical protein